MSKKILYVDMDGTIVDFESGLPHYSEDIISMYKDRFDEIPRLFSKMTPIVGALEAFRTVAEKFDTYLLTTVPWNNPTGATDKIAWVNRHLPEMRKRVIMSHHKHLNIGDFLVDDRAKNGAERFTETNIDGEWIQIGSEEFPTWVEVSEYLLERA